MKFKAILPVLMLLILTDCRKKEKGIEEVTITPSVPSQNTFSRKALLLNIADNIITPSIDSLHFTADSLNIAALQFCNDPGVSNLLSLRKRLERTWRAWEYCSWFKYKSLKSCAGIKEGSVLREDEFDFFPASPDSIESRINRNIFLFEDDKFNVRGLNAIDYLINSSADSIILQKFQNSDSRKTYLKEVSKRILAKAECLSYHWQIDIVDFLIANGTNGTSSVSQLVQMLGDNLEYVTDYKLGIPVGREIGGSILTAFPQKTEAYYNGKSIDFLIANVDAIERIWSGRNSESAETGLDDYLVSTGNQDLLNTINSAFASVKTKAFALNHRALSQQVLENQEQVRVLYHEAGQLKKYFKTDLPSALGITIDYSTGDGD